ncbi:PilW family protein [Lyngbya sp. PCC 8106]|uniref:PilW family protein n=1 Tax=Lyngbya sp. (strain PCC 8106) TaxID=313612 RepID=UPI0000EAAA5C|nr:hypothetical protein [Lyngbya sp. PCC 8106]EAW35925.1 hypothetical protein L8106_07621 [Lyngbya sp. PCC 8106]
MTLLQLLLKTRSRSKPSEPTHSTDGFTMIELVVGAVIAFLIMGPLLGFVVNILNDDSREQVKTTTDYELQAAVDFISEDLSQAYYIYDPEHQEDEKTINQIDAIQAKLPRASETPILVFWKLHRLRNAIPIPGSRITAPKNCTPDECNDTSVRAVVAYYLVKETNPNSIWCQPTTGDGKDCPQRIVRYLAHEPLEKFRGTGIPYPEGDLKDSQKGTLMIPNTFSLEEDPISSSFPAVSEDPQVLVNYISCFSDSICYPDQDSEDRIDVSDTNDSVQFTIKANAMRRIDGKKTGFCESDEGQGSAYCPKASVRVQGLKVKIQ